MELDGRAARVVAVVRLEHGDVEVIWQGPAREDMRQEQQNIVERFTSEGVDAIVLAPCDRQTLVAPVAKARMLEAETASARVWHEGTFSLWAAGQ